MFLKGDGVLESQEKDGTQEGSPDEVLGGFKGVSGGIRSGTSFAHSNGDRFGGSAQGDHSCDRADCTTCSGTRPGS